MIESGANRAKCHFVTSHQAALMKNTNPMMQAHVIVSENLSIAFQKPWEIKMFQCWAVGFSILEISKFIMQSLMYKAVKPAFGNRLTTLLTDTDSWVLAVPCKTENEVMEKLWQVMDFSNYPSSHRLHSNSVKNKTGFLKNEMPTDTIEEVVAVRSKTYAIKATKTMETRCKGIREVAKKKIPFDSFKKSVLDFHEESVTQFTIQSKTHQNRLMKQTKVAFSSFDDKRYLLCGIHSVPYGSFLIAKSKAMKKCVLCAYPKMFI